MIANNHWARLLAEAQQLLDTNSKSGRNQLKVGDLSPELCAELLMVVRRAETLLNEDAAQLETLLSQKNKTSQELPQEAVGWLTEGYRDELNQLQPIQKRMTTWLEKQAHQLEQLTPSVEIVWAEPVLESTANKGTTLATGIGIQVLQDRYEINKCIYTLSQNGLEHQEEQLSWLDRKAKLGANMTTLLEWAIPVWWDIAHRS